MKKGVKIALPLLLVAVMVVTAVLVSMFTVTAADATEATLTSYTVNYGTDSSAESYGYEVSTTKISSKTGSFADLAKELATLAPSADTRYVLQLNKDITVDTAVSIKGNEHTEVQIKLGGHSITSTVNGPTFVLSGSGATVRIDGQFASDGSLGRFVGTAANSALVKIAAGSGDFAHVKYVDATFSANAADTAYFIAEGGEITIERSSIENLLGSIVDVVSANGAKVNLKYTDVAGGTSTTLVGASSSDVYIEGGNFKGLYIVDSDNTASNILITGLECEVDIGFIQGSADTKTYILGAAMEIYTAIASGEANANNLWFYYGDGTMYIIGQDFSQYGIANSDVFTVDTNGDTWTMKYTGSDKAMATVATPGQVPAVTFGSTADGVMKASLLGVGVDMSGISATTVRVGTMLANISGTVGTVTYKGSERASVIFDINGFTLTNTSTSSASFLNSSHNMNLTTDGASAEGKIGTFISAAKYQRFYRATQKSAYGQVSYHLVNSAKNLNMEFTNLSSASGVPVFDITAGSAFFENVKMTYTGTKAASVTTATTCIMIGGAHTSYTGGVIFADGVTVESTATNAVGVQAISVGESWDAYVNNFTTKNVSLALTVVKSSGYTYLADSDIATSDAAFSGAGKITAKDIVVDVPSGKLCSGSVALHFLYGNGATVVTTDGSEIAGAITAEGNFNLNKVSTGVYKITSGSDRHSLKMPVVFADGMMLQRNKASNIYGYCNEVGDTVRVTIVDKDGATIAVSEAVVGEGGRWDAKFNNLDAAFGATIKIKQVGKGDPDKADITIKDVNIGEIWVVAGQSNASLAIKDIEDVDELATLAETLGIREFTNSGYKLKPQQYGEGSWQKVTSSSVSTGTMSALGYATVAKLAAELGSDVPVGLITIANGSTKICTWMDLEHLDVLSPTLANSYRDWLAQGTLPSSAHGNNAVGTVIYNDLVYPLEGFTTAGLLWYQGEGDIPGKAYSSTVYPDKPPFLGPEGSTYTDYFTALREIFCRAFDNGDGNLPIYVMQLAPYARSGDGPSDGSYIYQFRLEQYDMCQSLPNTYLVPIANEGTAFTSQDIAASMFIHPARKSPVAYRTADMILKDYYGINESDVYMYPNPISAVNNADGSVTITFDTDLELMYGDAPDGFELTANGSTWVKATGVIDGNKLILTASGVTSAVGVRYASSMTLVELRDGTVIAVKGASGQYTLSEDKKTFDLIDSTGKHHTIRVDSTDVIRTMNAGNITNASGIPLVAFSMDVVSAS